MFASTPLLAELNIGLFIMEMLLFLTSLFLMLLVLVQRGKGGGLTGALGGSGGSSAFGAKAGDAFTKITMYVAGFWILLCMLTIAFFNKPPEPNASLKNPSAVGASDTDTEEGATGDSSDETTDEGTPATGGTNDNDFEPPVTDPGGDGNAVDPGNTSTEAENNEAENNQENG